MSDNETKETPVSYTHLDVYKRQSQKRAIVTVAEGQTIDIFGN